MLSSSLSRAFTVAASLILLGISGPAAAHAERQSFFPNTDAADTPRHARPAYRGHGSSAPRLVVCKKAGDEGVAAGEDSASRIARMSGGSLKTFNQQLLGQCQFEHLQEAVDAVPQRGTNIYVLPGLYREEPSIRALDERAGAAVPADTTFCQAVLARGPGRLTYEEQYRCRFIQNTVAVFGDPDFTDDDCGTDIEGVCTNPETQVCNPETSDCRYYDLQIEGTGEKPTDVILEGDFITKPGDPSDGHFRYLNGIRIDRADGAYLRNFTTQIFEFNSIYVLETDGFVLDKLLARWVDEYSILSFASDNGLYTECGGYGAADSVLYPGSGADIYRTATHATSNLRERSGTEIRNSFASHAAGGYSGTAGNSPWVHHNVFRKNQLGLATESIFGGHPGMPQDHGLYENNLVYGNNKNYFGYVESSGPCIAQTPRDRGVVPPEWREFDSMPPEMQEAILDRMVLCPGIPFPSGAGMVIGGGNYDVNQNNTVFDNWKQGYMLFHVPAVIRHTSEEDPPTNADPLNPFDNSHFNRFLNNHFAENTLVTPHRIQPNGADFWFDNSGVGNCWDGNTSGAPGGATHDLGDPVHDALGLPGGPCTDGPIPDAVGQTLAENPVRIGFLVSCILYDRNDPTTKSPLCPFFDPPVAPAGREGETTVISSQPTKGESHAGETAKSGYFVLNNDTGDTHTVTAVTIAADGATARLAGAKLSVTTTPPAGRKTVTATLTQVGASNVFTFDEPAVLDPQNYVLFELETTAVGGSSAALAAQRLWLASGAGSAVFGVLLVAGGVRQRRRVWMALVAALCAGLIVGCSADEDLDLGGSGGSTANFTLSSIAVTTSGGSPVTYAGMPLKIGAVTVQ